MAKVEDVVRDVLSLKAVSKMVSKFSETGFVELGGVTRSSKFQWVVRLVIKWSGRVADMDDSNAESTSILEDRNSLVLVIITGGTIAMKNKNGVFVTESNYIHRVIGISPILHDKEFAEHIAARADGSIPFIQGICFVLPKLHVKEKRVIYHLLEYDVLLDSANMNITDYKRIAHDIKANYEHYDGFVVLHGTDTMAYTASYLSFMFENLGKSVILTGAQVPLCATRSDGVDNLLGSLLIAGNYTIPEVALFFHHRLYRGNRCSKIDISSFQAFDSPNFNPLVVMGVEINVHWDLVWRSAVPKACSIRTEMEQNVVLLRLFPGISTDTVKAFLNPPIAGVVLQTYGAGNGPSNRADIFELLKDASRRRVLIVNCSQCSRGSVTPAYETGKAFAEAGIASGYDMTLEAALAKLSYLLGRADLSYEQKFGLLEENLRGELTKVERVGACRKRSQLFDAISSSMKLNSDSERRNLETALYPSMLCSAAMKDSVETLDKLRNEGADLCVANFDGRTPLHVAASEGSSNAVQYLLGQGACVYAKDRFGCTPLQDAIRFRKFDIIRFLREAGAHLSLPSVRLGETLCALAYRNDLQGLRAWASGGVDMSAKDYNSKSALDIATENKSLEVIDFLSDCVPKSCESTANVSTK